MNNSISEGINPSALTPEYYRAKYEKEPKCVTGLKVAVAAVAVALVASLFSRESCTNEGFGTCVLSRGNITGHFNNGIPVKGMLATITSKAGDEFHSCRSSDDTSLLGEFRNATGKQIDGNCTDEGTFLSKGWITIIRETGCENIPPLLFSDRWFPLRERNYQYVESVEKTDQGEFKGSVISSDRTEVGTFFYNQDFGHVLKQGVKKNRNCIDVFNDLESKPWSVNFLTTKPADCKQVGDLWKQEGVFAHGKLVNGSLEMPQANLKLIYENGKFVSVERGNPKAIASFDNSEELIKRMVQAG